MSRESSFSSMRSSKLSDVLKIPLIEPIKNEKNVNPINSSAIEKMYSSEVAPVKSPYPTVVITSNIQ